MCLYYQNTNKNSLTLLNLSLIIFLVIFFFSSESLNLYVIFELSVLPIFIIIIGWGYQTERLEARLRLLFYTITASLPLLGIYLWIFLSSITTKLILIEKILNLNNSFISKIIIFCLLAAFMVKLPIYRVHLWLPKAHVEAPVFGSIILAAILLKLGRFGLWVFIPYVYLDIVNIYISVRLIGSVLVSILCLRLTDLKIIIAYSSVSHIGCVLIPILISNSISSFGGILLILAHGVRSSAIFLISFYLYQINYSRRLLITKGLLIRSGLISLFWFLILMINIAAPPTLNLLAEILVITRRIYQNKFNFLIFILIIVVGTVYSLIIFSSSIQGNKTQGLNIKILSIRESLVIFNHLVWGFLLILRISLCNFKIKLRKFNF
jgi:NADH-ubiquinone oxidoreductase chain 4